VSLNLTLPRHLALFFILAVVLGGGVIVLVAQGIIPSSWALVSVFSASVSGIIMIAAEKGRAGLKRLFQRLLIWRVGVGYWLFSFFFVIPVFLLGSLLNPLFGGEPLSFRSAQPGFEIIPMFIGFFILVGLGQELGWTGFLLTRLQSKYSAFISSCCRAIIVGAWHLPLLLFANFQNPAFSSFPYGGWIAQEGFLLTFMVLVLLFALPWSIFHAWIFNNTGGSLLLAAILHASEIWVAYLMMNGGIDPGNINNYWGYGALMLLSAILLVMITGSQDLSRKYKRIADWNTGDIANRM
jgi:membrane protease YdiL (CAAX protease family)